MEIDDEEKEKEEDDDEEEEDEDRERQENEDGDGNCCKSLALLDASLTETEGGATYGDLMYCG